MKANTSMLSSGPKIHELQNNLNENLHIVSDWLKANKLLQDNVHRLSRNSFQE